MYSLFSLLLSRRHVVSTVTLHHHLLHCQTCFYVNKIVFMEQIQNRYTDTGYCWSSGFGQTLANNTPGLLHWYRAGCTERREYPPSAYFLFVSSKSNLTLNKILNRCLLSWAEPNNHDINKQQAVLLEQRWEILSVFLVAQSNSRTHHGHSATQ